MLNPYDTVSIAMASYDDYEGVWGTLAALRAMQQTANLRLAVVDNNPTGPQAEAHRKVCEEFHAEYIACPVVGNARAKDAAVRSSPTPWRLVMDSHVVLQEGAVYALIEAIAARGDAPDAHMGLLHGPLKVSMGQYHTSMTDVWSSLSWGQWSDAVARPVGPPFPIEAHGMGLFAAHRDGWAAVGGFHPDLVGWTGEEWYIHEKYRRFGGSVWCVPGLDWSHRFAQPYKPMPQQYAATVKHRNYRIALADAGIDPTRMEAEFAPHVEATTVMAVVAAGPTPAPPVADWVTHMPEGVVVLDLEGVWDYVYDLGPGDLPGCSLQLSATGPLFDAAVKYARRAVTAYGGGQPDGVLCDRGRVGFWAEKGAGRIAYVTGFSLPPDPPPKGYTVYRAYPTLVVYTSLPGDREPALPGMIRMAKTLALSLVKGGVSAASGELVAQRVAICQSNGGVCPTGKRRISDNRCSECGCALEYKLRLAGQECPDGHW